MVVSNHRITSTTAAVDRSAVARRAWTLLDDLHAAGGAATAAVETSGFATIRSKAAADCLSPVMANTAAIDVMHTLRDHGKSNSERVLKLRIRVFRVPLAQPVLSMKHRATWVDRQSLNQLVPNSLALARKYEMFSPQAFDASGTGKASGTQF